MYHLYVQKKAYKINSFCWWTTNVLFYIHGLSPLPTRFLPRKKIPNQVSLEKLHFAQGVLLWAWYDTFIWYNQLYGKKFYPNHKSCYTLFCAIWPKHLTVCNDWLWKNLFPLSRILGVSVFGKIHYTLHLENEVYLRIPSILELAFVGNHSHCYCEIIKISALWWEWSAFICYWNLYLHQG